MNSICHIRFLAPLIKLGLLSYRNAGSISFSRQSKMLNKLVYGKVTAKRKRFIDGDTPKLTTASALSNPSRQGKNASRRVNVLNMLFMQNISDLLVNGEVAYMIAGSGLEISTVRISPDFSSVNVYWVAKGCDKDEELTKTLKQISGWIRHELSQLRLMGEVPRINFVKDSRLSKLAEVDALLAKADFGDDYEPATASRDKLPIDLIEQLSTENNSKALPQMRHDIFGLDRQEIMSKIQQNMNKTRQAWEKYEAFVRPNDLSSNSENQTQDELITLNKDKIFAKFLIEREYSRGKLEKERKEKEFDAKDYYEDEIRNAFNGDDDFVEEKDYVEEDCDDRK